MLTYHLIIIVLLIPAVWKIVQLGMKAIKKRRSADYVPATPTPQKPTPTVVLILVGMIGFPLAILATYTLVQWRAAYADSLDWPSTSGTVTRAEVTSRYDRNNDDRKGTDNRIYTAHLTYEYSVADEVYSNNDRRFSVGTLIDHGLLEGIDLIGHGGIFYRDSEAEDALGGYHTGQTVTVFYNPDNPGQSVLEHHFDDRAYYIFTAVTIMLALVGQSALSSLVKKLFAPATGPATASAPA